MITHIHPQEPDIVGDEFGGQWIAWDDDNVHIVASAATSEQAQQQARAAGVAEPTIEFVPPADGTFVGGL